jgi:hypothetical protein
MRPFDPRSWNSLAASGFALAACGILDYDDEDYYHYVGYYDDESSPSGCSGWNECEAGYVCIDQECLPAHEPIECMDSALIEVPLPELEPALAIAFADLDGDGDDELVSIGATRISVVLADDSVVLTPWPQTRDYTWLTVLEQQDDAFLDLAVGFPLGMLLLRGTGEGGFLYGGTLESLPDIGLARAVDFDGDGIDQLAAAQTGGGNLLWFSNVDEGVWRPLDHLASTVTIAHVWDLPRQVEILASQGCALSILQATGFQSAWTLDDDQPDWHCDWFVDSFASVDPGLLAVSTVGDMLLTQLTVIDPDTRTGTAASIPNFRARASTMIDLEGDGEPVLALGSDSNLALVRDWSQFPDLCVEFLEGGADQLAAGDREGDGRQELAILHEGTIRLLHLP